MRDDCMVCVCMVYGVCVLMVCVCMVDCWCVYGYVCVWLCVCVVVCVVCMMGDVVLVMMWGGGYVVVLCGVVSSGDCRCKWLIWRYMCARCGGYGLVNVV